MKRIALFTAISMIILCINLFPEKIVVLQNLNNPSMVDISDGEIYILDNYAVKIYSLNDFRFLREFGKKGEGPGELLTTIDTKCTMIVKDHVLLMAVHKIIVFEKSGKMIQEKRFQDYLIEAIPFRENYVTIQLSWIDKELWATVNLYDDEFIKIKQIYKTKLPQSYKKGKFVMPPIGIYARCTKNEMFLFDMQKDSIEVFDQQGKPKREIIFQYEQILTDDAFTNKIHETLKQQPAFKRFPDRYMKMLDIMKNLPVFRNSWILDKHIYIQTYREKQNKSEFLVLDFSGKVENKLFLPGSTKLNIRINPASTFTFYKGEYYYLKENLDHEEWELHKMKLN